MTDAAAAPDVLNSGPLSPSSPHSGTWNFALVGTPNCGKTALFNALTGGRQKVANYPGVTVERKTGAFVTPGRALRSAYRSSRHLFAARAQPR